MATAEREGGRLPWGTPAVTLGFVARAALVVILLCALAGLVWLGRDVVFIAFFAVLVASFLSIFVGWLEARGVPRAAAAVSVLLLGVGMAAAAGALLWPTLREQALELRERLPAALTELVSWADGQYQVLSGEFGAPAEPIQEHVRQRVTMEAARLLTGALPLLNSLVGAVGGGLVVLFAGLYLAIEPRLYLDGLVSLVPRRNRPRVRRALEDVGSTLRRWILGTALSMALIAVLTSAGLWLLDIPAALALGLLAGLLEFIPYFGPILSAVPALVLALVISPTKALWVLLLYVGIQQAESNLVLPLLMKGMVQLPPALTVLVQVLMSVLFGFLGLLLAVPALAAGKVLIQTLYVEGVADAG
ncbi:MAG TPA: AI-2E family transporter [Longimicrobiales bacterium]